MRVTGQEIKVCCPEPHSSFVVSLKVNNGRSRRRGIGHDERRNMSTNAIMSEPKSLRREHNVVSQEEWIVARKELLKKEKESTRLRDQLSAERRKLPWVKVEKNYVFDAPGGKVTLADLFAGRSQLVIYHFMFGPGWEAGCPYCSFLVDHLDGALPHLEHHDVSVVVVSRAPLAEIEPFNKR